MPIISELLASSAPPDLARSGLPTGLSDLDTLTRGILPGTLWVVLATPGTGRTTLACQLAVRTGAAGAETVLILGNEPPATALANILCAEGRVPQHGLLAGGLDEEACVRLADAQLRASRWPLWVLTTRDDAWHLPTSTSTPDARRWFDPSAVMPRRIASVLIMDVADALAGGDSTTVLAFLPRLRAWAQGTGMAIIVTVPEEGLLEGDAASAALRRHSDVALRLQRSDLLDFDATDAGEATIHVLRHRNGPAARITVAFQGHFRQFTDLQQLL